MSGTIAGEPAGCPLLEQLQPRILLGGGISGTASSDPDADAPGVLVETAATDVIVDNVSATVVGDWQAATYRPDYHGADYLHDKN